MHGCMIEGFYATWSIINQESQEDDMNHSSDNCLDLWTCMDCKTQLVGGAKQIAMWPDSAVGGVRRNRNQMKTTYGTHSRIYVIDIDLLLSIHIVCFIPLVCKIAHSFCLLRTGLLIVSSGLVSCAFHFHQAYIRQRCMLRMQFLRGV